MTVAATVIDIGDPVPACGIRSITSSEADNGLGDGNTPADVSFSGGLVASLRAERAGSGPGRAYTLVVRCTDVFGNHTDGTLVVKVPHSQ